MFGCPQNQLSEHLCLCRHCKDYILLDIVLAHCRFGWKYQWIVIVPSARHLLPKPVYYHWRELPQVSFLSRQTCVWREKQVFVATKIWLSPPNKIEYGPGVCRDKSFVATKYFCRDKIRVLTRQPPVCRDKNDTCGSSRQCQFTLSVNLKLWKSSFPHETQRKWTVNQQFEHDHAHLMWPNYSSHPWRVEGNNGCT